MVTVPSQEAVGLPADSVGATVPKVISLPLLLPVTAGAELTIRMR